MLYFISNDFGGFAILFLLFVIPCNLPIQNTVSDTEKPRESAALCKG